MMERQGSLSRSYVKFVAFAVSIYLFIIGGIDKKRS